MPLHLRGMRAGWHGLARRFPAEKGIDANKGLNVAMDLLEPIKAQFPWISYSDLWTLAGAVAIEDLGGARCFCSGPLAAIRTPGYQTVQSICTEDPATALMSLQAAGTA